MNENNAVGNLENPNSARVKAVVVRAMHHPEVRTTVQIKALINASTPVSPGVCPTEKPKSAPDASSTLVGHLKVAGAAGIAAGESVPEAVPAAAVVLRRHIHPEANLYRYVKLVVFMISFL
ncbi:hypothetical protein VP1G_11269 [Cytospora mali]|uniref:Uncharacterized protein n=1 Tax=Cytospora mali TaxID=578113 RepID=A0A194VBN6_CYTMA|nr:hypothetical protein VP1G_11269 [Valsa mali var. pyri (nom. inval.)]